MSITEEERIEQLERDNQIMREALERIIIKNPNKVPRFESADLAVEFRLVAIGALAAISKVKND